MSNRGKNNSEPRRDWTSAHFDRAALEALQSGLPATGLWSLLMGVAEKRAGRRTPSELRRQWQSDRFVVPSYVDQRTQYDIDAHLLAVAKEFDALDLSPVAPLGSCSVVAPTSQNRIVSTMRGTEVLSDPTNVLALESARRLQADPKITAVRLATSHRCVRAQALPKGPGFAAHFRLFCITTAGHETQDHSFAVDAFTEHLRFHLDAFARLNEHGYRLGGPHVKLSTVRTRAHLIPRIVERFSNVSIELQPLTQSYYDGLRFTVSAQSPEGEEIMLSDGGVFDWLQKLAFNRKLVFVASAMGSQRAAALFKK